MPSFSDISNLLYKANFSRIWNAVVLFPQLSSLQDRDSLRTFQFSLPDCHSSLNRYLKNCQDQETGSGKGRQGKQKAVQKYGKCCSSWPLCQFHAFTPLNECSKCFILGASDSGVLIAMASGISGHSWPLGHPCVHGSFLKIREIKYRLFSALMGESHCEQLQDQWVFFFFSFLFSFIFFFQTQLKPHHLWGIWYFVYIVWKKQKERDMPFKINNKLWVWVIPVV